MNILNKTNPREIPKEKNIFFFENESEKKDEYLVLKAIAVGENNEAKDINVIYELPDSTRKSCYKITTKNKEISRSEHLPTTLEKVEKWLKEQKSIHSIKRSGQFFQEVLSQDPAVIEKQIEIFKELKLLKNEEREVMVKRNSTALPNLSFYYEDKKQA